MPTARYHCRRTAQAAGGVVALGYRLRELHYQYIPGTTAQSHVEQIARLKYPIFLGGLSDGTGTSCDFNAMQKCSEAASSGLVCCQKMKDKDATPESTVRLSRLSSYRAPPFLSFLSVPQRRTAPPYYWCSHWRP